MGIRELVMAAVVGAETVDAEVLGQKVKVRKQLSAGELLAIAAAKDKASARVAICIMDETGKPLFESEAQAGAINWDTFEPLLELTTGVKGLEIEAAEKKSKPRRSSASA